MTKRQIQYYHWQGFNFLVRRIIAPLWLIGGGIGFVLSLPMVLNPTATIDVDGVPTNDLSVKILVTVVCLAVSVFGLLMYRSPKYVPQEIERQDDSP